MLLCWDELRRCLPPEVLTKSQRLVHCRAHPGADATSLCPRLRRPAFSRTLPHPGNPQIRNGKGDCRPASRSEEHTSELQSLMRTSYALFCLKKKKITLHPYTCPFLHHPAL